MAEHFKIVGTIPLCVHGLAPRRALQNILGDNWRTPPLAVDRVSYVYISGEEKAVQLADLYDAKLREQHVYTDGPPSVMALSESRKARLIYHGNNAQRDFATQGTIICLVVLETIKKDERWMHLVYSPEMIMPEERPIAFSSSSE
jgi:hypothetical protein